MRYLLLSQELPSRTPLSSHLKEEKKKQKVSLLAVIRLLRANDITKLQCCTLRERCQSYPSDANSLSTGHLALLRSRHHGVTTHPFISGCYYADGRRSAQRVSTHLGGLPVLPDSPGHIPAGADIERIVPWKERGRPSHA